LVPITGSTCKGLKYYLTNRAEKGYVTTPDAPVFVNHQGYPLSKSTVQHAFVTIRKMAGFHAVPGVRLPRLHDFRHTAAVKRLYLWYHEGKNVQALLPVLATFLGHSDIRCTEVYLTTTSELLQEANDRFEKHYDINQKSDGFFVS
jgi:integrase